MTKYSGNKRRNAITITAIITMVIFAVLLYAVQNPLKFQKITRSAYSNFDTNEDFVKFIDVGQADCALIYSNGYSALIDVGLPNTANDLSMDLNRYGVTELDAVVISHLHSDHIGGLTKIAKNFEIENLIMPKILQNSISAAQNGKNIATSGGSAFYNAVQGMNFRIGEFEITLLSDFGDNKNENNRSLFVMAEINGIKFLFTGDAELKAENLLLDENLNIDCDVLKVSHHGSNTASSKKFLEATTPEYAVISVGEDNIYSHPHSATLGSLENTGAEIYRTDQSGDITFNIDNKNITIETEHK